ncbi:hypothetical protein ETH_00038675, partial [Eimeria tenella]
QQQEQLLQQALQQKLQPLPRRVRPPDVVNLVWELPVVVTPGDWVQQQLQPQQQQQQQQEEWWLGDLQRRSSGVSALLGCAASRARRELLL